MSGNGFPMLKFRPAHSPARICRNAGQFGPRNALESMSGVSVEAYVGKMGV